MTRKDYIKFAQMFHAIKPERDLCDGDTHYSVLRSQWMEFMLNTSCLFKEDNPRFSASRFETACETGKM